MKTLVHVTSKLFVVGLMVGIIGSIGIAGNVLASDYYVDPSSLGNDNNSGSLSSPWKKFRASVDKLRPGDTLYLRGGTYYENSTVNITVSGTESNHITIKNYSGESPIIDGGYQDFRTAPNSEWVLHDGARNIYRSINTYPNLVNGGLQAYLTAGSTTTHLTAYERYDDLASDNQLYTDTGSIYLGPGSFWNSTDQRIYIRLVLSDLETQMGYNIPSNNDPRQNSIYIVRRGQVVDFNNNASYIDIEGISFRYRNNALRFSSGHHIKVKDVTVLGGATYILTEEGAHDLVFDNIRVDGYFPPWLSFKDIKSATRPAHAMEVSAFVVHNSANVTIMNSNISNVMDAIGGGGNDFHIYYNNFLEIRDDVLQLNTNCNNVDMAYNRVINCSKSFDRDEAANAINLGTKYVHHNIIDLRKRHLHFRPGDPLFGRAGGDGKIQNRAFGTHGAIDMDPWKIYHNTIIVGKAINANFVSDGIGFDYDETLAPGVPHEVYNNIFIQSEDHMMGRGSRVHDGSQILDGNLYYREAQNAVNPLFFNWENGANRVSFNSLAEFKSSSFFQATKSNYAPGWENSGLEADPMLDDEYYPAADGPASGGAVDLSAKGWPGVSNETYRGALEPLLDTSSPNITISLPTDDDTYITSRSIISLSGIALDNTRVDKVNWINDRGDSGIAEGTNNWSVAYIPLAGGVNQITVCAFDAAGNTANDTLNVTRGSAPTVNTAESSNMLAHSAIVSALVNPNGLNTTMYFQYGTNSADYMGKTANQIVGGMNQQNVSVYLSGLSEATTYYYRAAAVNSLGSAYGSEMNFTTADISAPQGTLSINNGAMYANTTMITLNLNANDNRAVTGYYVSNSNSTPSASAAGWVAVNTPGNFSANVSYSLATGNGLKTVYCWYKDYAGNMPNAVSDSITLDTLPPRITITSPTSSPSYRTRNRTLNLGGTADNVRTVVWDIKINGAVVRSGTANGTTNWSVPGIPLSLGSNLITVTAIDRANNRMTDTINVTRN